MFINKRSVSLHWIILSACVLRSNRVNDLLGSDGRFWCHHSKNILHLFNAEDVVLAVCIWMLSWAAVCWDVHITWRWIMVRNVTCMLLFKSIYFVCISFLMIVRVVGWLYQSQSVWPLLTRLMLTRLLTRLLLTRLLTRLQLTRLLTCSFNSLHVTFSQFCIYAIYIINCKSKNWEENYMFASLRSMVNMSNVLSLRCLAVQYELHKLTVLTRVFCMKSTGTNGPPSKETRVWRSQLNNLFALEV